MTTVIAAADVLLDLPAGGRLDLLKTLATHAARRLPRPEAEILGALQNREALGSTALGRGVALPHTRLRGNDPPLMLLARLMSPIDYDAPDEEPVDLVVLMLWPEDSPDGFLPALAETCRALREPAILRGLRAATSAEEVASLLRRHGGAVAEPKNEG
ncbi:MAG: nitrogen regulatory protein [Rhodospirillales bacterium]|nr:nitrogen regulatory protein [Rhodospirillales bacterium]MDB5380494.1 nitrogen regulatory protein [Rhodospirillales bacterium]